MDKVQASILMFVLMGVVIIITFLSVRKKRGTPTETIDRSLKANYENALKAGDRQAILKEGRKYYSALRKDTRSEKEQMSNDHFAGKQHG